MNRSTYLIRTARQVLGLRNSSLLYSIKTRQVPVYLQQSVTFKRTFVSEKPKEPNEAAEDPSQDSNPDKAESSTPENEFQKEIKKMKEDFSVMKEKYQRSIAENENVRTRMRKEISDAKIYGIQGFCKDLLEVADVLDKAVHSVPEEILGANSHPDHEEWMNFYDGVFLTKNQLLKVFERHGLIPLTPARGDKFDPNIHEALFQASDPELDSGLVAHINSIGYTLHKRTLRPAQVGVSKK